MAQLKRQYDGLKLQVNEAKSAVASVFGRKFLGYALWVGKGKEVKCKVAEKPLQNFKARVRQLTRRSVGRSIEQVVGKLRPYLLGWKAYFGMAQTPRVWRELDEWLRHRLRTIRRRQWKRPKTIYRELKALGAKDKRKRPEKSSTQPARHSVFVSTLVGVDTSALQFLLNSASTTTCPAVGQ